MPTPEEISNLCRLCLEKRQVSVLIFEEQTRTRSTFVKISSCLPVKVSKSDALPKKICEVCSGKLDSFYEFWKQSSESEKQLQDWLKQPPPEPAPDPMPVLKQEEVDFKGIGYSNSESAPSTSILSSILQTQVSDEPPLKKTKFVTEPDTILHTYDSDEEIEAKVEQIEDNSNDSNSNGEAEGLDYGDDGQVNPDNPDDQPGPSGVGKSSDETPFKIKINPTKEQKPYICHFCNKSFGTLNRLKVHSEAHSLIDQQDVYACRLCPEKYPNKDQLRCHLKNDHSETMESTKTKLTCEICSESFTKNYLMTIHLKKHRQEYKFKCEKCDLGFWYMSHYKVHMSRHEGTTYSCDDCSKVFKDEAYYKKHLEIHKPEFDEAELQCPICSKKLASKMSYEHHKKIHQERTCQFCDICGMTVSTTTNLRIHMRKHTGEKPYKCETCGKCFTAQTYLTVHSVVHTKKRRYVCSICEKAFTQNGSLLIHMRSHTGERPYECFICSKKFITKSVLKKHNCKGPSTNRNLKS